MAEGPPPSVGWTELVAGAALFALCGAFVLIALRYGVGTPARMGPGFFPFSFGLVGMAIAVVIVVKAFLIPSEGGLDARWRPILFISAAVVAFALLIDRVGLAPAVFLATILSSLADRDARPIGTLVLAVALTIGIWLVFVRLLGLPIRLFVVPL